MDNGTVSIRQFKVLVFLYAIGTAILIFPSGLAADAKQDAWIAAAVGQVIGLLIVWLYIRLGRSMGGTGWIEYCRGTLGQAAGSAIGAVFVLYSFVGAATLLYYVGDFITTQIMEQPPMEAIQLLFAFVVVLAPVTVWRRSPARRKFFSPGLRDCLLCCSFCSCRMPGWSICSPSGSGISFPAERGHCLRGNRLHDAADFYGDRSGSSGAVRRMGPGVSSIGDGRRRVHRRHLLADRRDIGGGYDGEARFSRVSAGQKGEHRPIYRACRDYTGHPLVLVHLL